MKKEECDHMIGEDYGSGDMVKESNKEEYDLIDLKPFEDCPICGEKLDD